MSDTCNCKRDWNNFCVISSIENDRQIELESVKSIKKAKALVKNIVAGGIVLGDEYRIVEFKKGIPIKKYIYSKPLEEWMWREERISRHFSKAYRVWYDNRKWL